MNAAWYQRMSIAFVVLLFISPATVAVAQPAIIATISPPPNEFGWNNTPVVVSFYCQRALDCPAPLSIHAEGLRQLVRSSVTDADGRTASVSIEISIEFSAPKIAILTPESGFETRRAAIDVHAHVTRSIAEIAIATCNGDRVPVLDSDAITCLSALRDGINDVVVQITDRAGNSASTGIQIHRVGTASSIIVVPDVRTLRVDETSTLHVVDNFGRTIAAPTWSVDDGSIVSVADDARSLTALASGSTTLTARAGSLEASMTMHVVAGERLPLGTVIWSIADLPGYREQGVITTAPCGDDFPKMISIQRGESRPDLVLRALASDGSQLWIEWPAVSPGERIGSQLTGDPACTGMFRVEDGSRHTSTIVRVGRPMLPELGTLWRYTSLATLGPEFSVFDKYVNVVETPNHGLPVLVRIDLLTGSPNTRIPLPHSVSTIDGACSADREPAHESPADVSDTPTVLVEGDVNLAVSTVEAINDSPRCPRGTARWTRTVQVLQILSDGSVSIRRVFEYPSSAVRVEVQLHKVLPDGHGGRLVMWKERTQGRAIAYRGVRVIDERLVRFDLATLGETIIAEEDMGVTTDGQTITGFDVTTGQRLWVLHADPGGHFGQLLAAGGGGFQVQTERGFEFIDRAGRRSELRD